MTTLPEINQLFEYKNAYLIDRYQRDYPNNKLSGKDALIELFKYLWLYQKHKWDSKNNPNDASLKFICTMHPEMQEIDDMWHTFLLFTREYSDFCMKYFGEFLHHVPEVGDDQPESDKFEVEFTRYLSYIYDHLGEETVKRWFAE